MENDTKEKVFTVNDLKWQIRKKRIQDAVKSVPHKMKEVWDNDKEYIIAAGPWVIWGCKRLAKKMDKREDEYHRDREVFDHSLGMWHELKRRMTSKEKAIFAERRKNGESVLSILDSMKLLKK